MTIDSLYGICALVNGDLVTLQGRISDSHANDLVASTGKVVVIDQPWIGSDE